MELSCSLGNARFPRAIIHGHIINPLLAKLLRSRWGDVDLVLSLSSISRRLEASRLAYNLYVMCFFGLLCPKRNGGF